MTTARSTLVLHHLRRLAGSPPAAQPPDAHLLERFTEHHDEAAFTALVRRHGAMVLNVCRSVLRHEQDAEDAFQATFLVLARHAHRIRHPEAVAAWLHGVAYRTALEAQANAARRRVQESKAPPRTPADPTLDMTVRDLQRVLHEELQRLPDKYRLPLVLCYLEDHSQEEAAARLGWSKGTLRGRLDRGRERLRRRLAARGVALSGLLAALALAPRASAEAFVDPVVRAAVPSALGPTAADTLSARASTLAEGVIRSMRTSKLEVATVALLLVGLIAGAGLGVAQSLGVKRPAAEQKPAVRSQAIAPSAPQPAVKPPEIDPLVYSGRVLGPDGRPVPGAKVYLSGPGGYDAESSPAPEVATTGPDGRFRFTAPKGPSAEYYRVVTATATRYGPGWVGVPAGSKRNDLTLRLVEDDPPIIGQIVDLEGKPVQGASLRVMQINAAEGEDLRPWLEAVQNKKGYRLELEHQYLLRYTTALCPRVTTDDKGRFRLTGIGRDRLVTALLEGPTITSEYVHVLTREGEPIRVTDHEGGDAPGDRREVTTYYGARFRYAATPSRPIVGVVRDKDTKKPLVGFTVRSYKFGSRPLGIVDVTRTTTDAQGRYRLTGMPRGEGNEIMIVPPGGVPYVAVHARVPDRPGLDAVTADVELKRGVWIEGRITDKVTGKPVQASVEYFALSGNPHLPDYDGFDGAIRMFNFIRTGEDGSYRVAGLPGPGVVAVYHPNWLYLRAPEREDEYGTRERHVLTAPYIITNPINYSALARINPGKGVESVKRDATLDPGWTFTGRLLGPDEKPLAGPRSFGLADRDEWSREGMKSAEFTVRYFHLQRPRPVLFVHAEKRLVGVAPLPKEDKSHVTVQMEPGATLTGQLVDAEGKPRAGVELAVSFREKGRNWKNYSPERFETDRTGRFRVEPLLPGFEFRLSDGQGRLNLGTAPRSGEAKELGTVRIEREKE
jgi:RNA polymerase sigma factor (sigma-70 family)